MKVIKVDRRDFFMKAKKMRHKGLVPANVFGGALKEPISLQVEKGTVKRKNFAAGGAGENYSAYCRKKRVVGCEE